MDIRFVFLMGFALVVSPSLAREVNFGPGTHEAGIVAVGSRDVVYIGAGALVRGAIVVSNANDVIVTGEGSIVGMANVGASIVVVDSSNVKIDGVTLKNPIVVRAVASPVSGVSASNVVVRPYTSEADFLLRKDVPCLVRVSVDGDRNLTCENLSFSNFRLLGGPSRCYSRVEAAVEGRPIRGVSFRDMPEGMELYKVGAVETDLPAFAYGNGYRKFLLFGWEMGCGITPEMLEGKTVEFAESGVDGVGARGAYPPGCTTLMHGPEWTKDMFRPQIPAYRRALAKQGLRHSFMGAFFRSPTNRIDWADDAAWRRIGRSMAVAAWFARETGMKGCLLDYEDYHRQKQFVRQPSDPPYDELARLVRRRARNLFDGVFTEYPEAAILSFWLLSIDRDYFRTPSARSIARNKGDLWPHVVNGILDAMPPSARLIDGNEEGYRFHAGRGDFNRSAVEQSDHVIELIAPENRAKYRAQFRVGYGLYVDAFEVSEESKWYRGPAGGSRTGGFALMAAEASYASSEYVWLWNESRQWIDWEKDLPRQVRTDTTRVKKLGGIGDVLRTISDPETYAFRRVAELKRDGGYVELAPDWKAESSGVAANGFVCAEDDSKLPKGIALYVSKKMERQRFGVDYGEDRALRAESANAVYLYSVKGVSFGETYAIGGSAKGRVRMLAAWKRDGVFDWTLPTVAVPFKDVGGKWSRALSAVRVPENCDELVVLLDFKIADGESAWVDRLSAAKIFTIPKDGE